MLGNFSCILRRLAGFFFQNYLLIIPSVSNILDPDQARPKSGLIWVQNVCKSYQQMTLGVKVPIMTITNNKYFDIFADFFWENMASYSKCQALLGFERREKFENVLGRLLTSGMEHNERIICEFFKKIIFQVFMKRYTPWVQFKGSNTQRVSC